MTPTLYFYKNIGVFIKISDMKNIMLLFQMTFEINTTKFKKVQN